MLVLASHKTAGSGKLRTLRWGLTPGRMPMSFRRCGNSGLPEEEERWYSVSGSCGQQRVELLHRAAVGQMPCLHCIDCHVGSAKVVVQAKRPGHTQARGINAK